MLRLFSILLAVVFMCGLFSPVVAAERLRLATTTSTEASGLLAELLPPFEQANDCKVDVIAVGTGKALKLGESGDVDVVLVHARSLEDQFMAHGYGSDRRDVMYNDFVLLGPPHDPAEALGTNDLVEVMSKIANSKVSFISRGDESGTHVRELQLWQAAGLVPQGSWYLEAGRGMGEVIIMANERQGYTLSDRGTYLAFKDKVDLKMVFAGDQRLFNPYGVIMVNPARHPHVKQDLARKFLDFLTSEEGQGLINGFQMAGEQLFYTQ
ncbi:substrate-binding domain-containing protein [Pelovirga terrestris]|uniref:Extracellular solute-binding protein n=1 Tax=Pelovirga terrestris TaxID=2771352 RepID=A0A8J6UHQ9_9BACT|nr:substrate-binding domain-containing protein [Pelovirga terrestris]MBD1401818.1 extracellular solute-binding protein [Pelovirga terrestris]